MYRILAIADIHWGAMDAKLLYDHLYSFLYFVERMESQIDMIVICGDYFDYRLSLNSKAALLAIRWMNELCAVARASGVKRISVLDGTEDHDNNQLEAFSELETSDGFFRIFRENTIDESLPGLKCLYCPDENINWKDYEEKYMANLMSLPDMMFFHGSFDVVLPDIVIQMSEETLAKSVVFNYNTFAGLVKGPIIGGHWHDAYDEPPLHYVGSFDSWTFGEENVKGFALIQYEPQEHSYQYIKIRNLMAVEYRTIINDTALYPSEDEYQHLIEHIRDIQKKNPGIMIRVKFLISDENPKNGEYLSALKHAFINDRTVKIVLKDLAKRVKKIKEREVVDETSSKYSFVFNRDKKDIAKIIQEFIHVSKDREIPLENINKHIVKHLEATGII